MNEKQTRRLFIVAFALSLLIHVVAVTFVRWPFNPKDETMQVVRVVHIRRIRIARVPTPRPPTPAPAPTAAPTVAPKVIHARPHRIGAHGIHPLATAGPVVTPAAPSPSPRASATPDCANHDTPVLVAVSPPPPDIPPGVRGAAKSGTARIQVDVSAAGAATGETIAQSSGAPALDSIALAMAKAAAYTPATHACKPVSGIYTFAVRFLAW